MPLSRKLVVVGPEKVGKSALIEQYCKKKFKPDYDPTIEGCDVRQVVVDDIAYLLDIIDTPGGDDLRSLRNQLISTGDGFLCVRGPEAPSISNTEWIHLLKLHTGKERISEEIPVIFIENKKDLLPSCRDPNMRTVSAKTGEGVDEAFAELVREIVRIEQSQKILRNSHSLCKKSLMGWCNISANRCLNSAGGTRCLTSSGSPLHIL